MKKLLALFLTGFALLAQAESDEQSNLKEFDPTKNVVKVVDQTVESSEQNNDEQSQEKESENRGIAAVKTSLIVAGKGAMFAGKGLWFVGKECAKAGTSFAFGACVGLVCSAMHKGIEEEGIMLPCPKYYKASILSGSPAKWKMENQKFSVPGTHKQVGGAAAVLSLLPAVTFGASGLFAVAGTIWGYGIFWDDVTNQK